MFLHVFLKLHRKRKMLAKHICSFNINLVHVSRAATSSKLQPGQSNNKRMKGSYWYHFWFSIRRKNLKVIFILPNVPTPWDNSIETRILDHCCNLEWLFLCSSIGKEIPTCYWVMLERSKRGIRDRKDDSCDTQFFTLKLKRVK